MANGEIIAYNIASFICALFVLEFGADKFIDHTAVVARRTGIPQCVMALLTAGAEWEEVINIVISRFLLVSVRYSLPLLLFPSLVCTRWSNCRYLEPSTFECIHDSVEKNIVRSSTNHGTVRSIASGTRWTGVSVTSYMLLRRIEMRPALTDG